MIGGVVMNVNKELVVKASLGDESAFSELYAQCYNDLYKFAVYTLGNKEDAADVVSDTFVDIWKGLPGIKKPEAFGAWAFRIISLRCKHEIGNLVKRRNTYNIEELIETPAETSLDVEENISESTALAFALGKLEAEERMIVVLSVLYGYTNKEIGEMLGKPQGTVSSKLHRTYIKLREYLGGENFG